MLPNGLKEIVDYKIWKTLPDKDERFPLFQLNEYIDGTGKSKSLNFLLVSIDNWGDDLKKVLLDEGLVLILHTSNSHALAELRRFFFYLKENQINVPVIIKREYSQGIADQTLLYGATDIGGLLIDGFGDGVFLSTDFFSGDKGALKKEIKFLNDTSFGILQAARTRMSKTEYISCPSCGRTLFDLQETTAMIRNKTDHLKGIKIGIMGCIVNGPGEMADADYGYVGSGKGKITLYKGKEVIKKGIPSESALDELIGLIKDHGDWKDPE
jgi:(E)-4-hydroxy-3-methylbut-2-enyl-diphosphate synthase